MGGGGLDTELWTVIRHGDYTVILTTSSQVSQSGLETRPDLTFTELYSSGGREQTEVSTLVKDFSRIEQTRLLAERMPRIYIQDSLDKDLCLLRVLRVSNNDFCLTCLKTNIQAKQNIDIIKVHKFIVLFSIEIEIFAGDREHSFIVMIQGSQHSHTKFTYKMMISRLNCECWSPGWSW